ncbi:MAG: hypothetical protein JW820_11780 [Spirochaetales bacterium]|nr:hypothetical protein [Spirochaetales bacterium]
MMKRTKRARKGRVLVALAGAAVLVLSFLLAGCTDDGILSGTITYNFFEDGDCYVVLDQDTDVTNGYAVRVILSVSAADTSVSYELDTAAVAPGSYYLMGAYDHGVGNMDPDDPSVWEAVGWEGSADENPPPSPTVSELSGVYDFSLTGLP